MRILDRYVIRNFLYSALMWFIVFMVLRTVADLFINMDEFAKLDKDLGQKLRVVFNYYALQQLVYFTELGGVIIVASAAFSLAMMNRTNELTAILASGVSLRRVVVPIVICAVMLSGLIVLDQEVLMPPNAPRLAMDRDDPLGESIFSVRMVSDGTGAIWFSDRYSPTDQVMRRPVANVRDELGRPLVMLSGESGHLVSGGVMFDKGQMSPLSEGTSGWDKQPKWNAIHTNLTPDRLIQLSGQQREGEAPVSNVRAEDGSLGLLLEAERFVPDAYRPLTLRTGELVNVVFTFRTLDGRTAAVFKADSARWTLDESRPGKGYWSMNARMFYPSDLTHEDLQLRQSSRWVEYLSTAELTRLADLKRLPDLDRAVLTRHIRFTEPLNNLIMLLLALPFILSRERNIKASAAMCLLIVGLFYAFIYISRYMGLPPALAAWLPAIVFGPVSVVMIDTIKT